MRTDLDLYADESRNRLEQKLEKMVKSVMVGALNSIEMDMGFLWGHGETELTPIQDQMRLVYEKVRTSIFDKGNSEIKKIKTELNNYSVGLKQGGITLPVVGERNEKRS